jgi:hypothetical protein
MLERYEPKVKTVFTRNPDYFLKGQPYVACGAPSRWPLSG